MSNWLSVAPSYGRANKVNAFTAKVDDNTSLGVRHATIVVKTIDDLETRNISVEQEEPVITMTSSNNQTAPAEIAITEDIHDFQVTVRGNIKFNVYSDVDWIPLNFTNLEPNKDHVIDVHIERNQTTEERVGHIVAYSKFFNIHEVFTINQRESENIVDLEESYIHLASNSQLHCPTYKQSLTEEPILFTSNAEITLTSNNDWISLCLAENGSFTQSVVVPKGDISKVKTVYVKCNNNYKDQTTTPNSEERTGSVTLSAGDEITVSVKQDGDREFVYWFKNMKFLDENLQEIRPDYSDEDSSGNEGYETVKNILNSSYWIEIRCPLRWKVKRLPFFLTTINVNQRQAVTGAFDPFIAESAEGVDDEILDSATVFEANVLYRFNFKVTDVHSGLDTRNDDMVVAIEENEEEETSIMFTQNQGLGTEGFAIIGGQGVGYCDNANYTTEDSWQKTLRELPIYETEITLLSNALTYSGNWTESSGHDISEYFLYFRPVIITGEYITPIVKNVKGTCVIKSTGKSISSGVGTFTNNAKAVSRYAGYYSSLKLNGNTTTAIRELVVKFTYGNEEKTVIVEQLTTEKITITPSDSSQYVNYSSNLTAVEEREYGLMLMKDKAEQIKNLNQNSNRLSVDLVVEIMRQASWAKVYLENSYDNSVFYDYDAVTEIFTGEELDGGHSLTTDTSNSSHTTYKPIKFTLNIPDNFLSTIRGGTELATIRVEDDAGNEKTYTLYLTYNFKDFGSEYHLWNDTPSLRNDMGVYCHHNKIVYARTPITLQSGIDYLYVDMSKVNIETNRYGKTIVKQVSRSTGTSTTTFSLTVVEYQTGGIYKGYFTISPDIDDSTLKSIMKTRMGKNTRVDVRATWSN